MILASSKQWLASVVLLLGLLLAARAEEVMPPAPARYFNDYANVVSAAVANQLNSDLEQNERASSNQLLVVIYPTMQTDSSLEDYCQRLFTAWKVGQKDKNNGAVLFVFVQEHKLRIQTGYGLEGALPDITCQQIIRNEIAPHLRQQDYDGGLRAGVTAMISATRGEYKASPQTTRRRDGESIVPVVWVAFILIIIIVNVIRSRGGTSYGRQGRSRGFFGGPFIGGGGGFGGFGGGGSGGGGGFSGGGGSSGGGGASGGW